MHDNLEIEGLASENVDGDCCLWPIRQCWEPSYILSNRNRGYQVVAIVSIRRLSRKSSFWTPRQSLENVLHLFQTMSCHRLYGQKGSKPRAGIEPATFTLSCRALTCV